jgi:geranylgeranyl diphosphate synthase, type I
MTTTENSPIAGRRVSPDEVRKSVDDTLREFFEAKAVLASGTSLAGVTAVLRDYVLTGGKRLRPLLCYCGWVAAGGPPGDPVILRAAASLELFHAFALIHDDIMDGSDERRGRPTLHRLLEADRATGDPERDRRFGVDSAILVGDLAMVWSDELLHGCGAPPRVLSAVRPLLDAMRTELMFGQYEDLSTTGTGNPDLATALSIASYKSGKYTVERPLHIGATLAGAEPALLDAFTAFGVPVGEAFQLRDDLLGIFGDPARTGKSALADLRDGKGTALLAIALRSARPDQRRVLTAQVGNPQLNEDGARHVRVVLEETRAVHAVEDMIEERRGRGLAALDRVEIRAEARAALRDLAIAATARTA